MRRAVFAAGITCWGLVLGGCGGSGGAPAPASTQPLGGIALAGSYLASTQTVNIMVALRDVPGTTTLQVSEAAGPAKATSLPTIAKIDKAAAHPFQIVTLTGTGFWPSGVATSVIFRPAGLQPVAVPAIAVTATTVEAAVPALVDANGENVAARASVQVFQATKSGSSWTAAFDGLEVGLLPTLGGAVPAGSFTLAYLTSELAVIDTIKAGEPGKLPASYWVALDGLRARLIDLAATVRAVTLTPGAQQPVDTAGGPGTVTLDEKSLALTDRILAALVLREAEALGLTTSTPVPSGFARLTTTDCPQSYDNVAIDEFLCQEQHYKQDLPAAGQKGLALGVRIETAFYLSVLGGAGTSVLGEIGSTAATTFELAWAAVTGHIAAWVSGSSAPTASQTMSDVGVTLLDRLAGTQGILGALYTCMDAGKEYDAIVAAQTQPSPTPTPTPTPTPQPSGSWAGTWSGTWNLTIHDTASGCIFQHGGAAQIVIAGTAGAYSGTFSLAGVQILNVPGCSLNSTTTMTGSLGSLAIVGSTFTADIEGVAMEAERSGDTLDGVLSNSEGTGTIVLTRR